MIVIQSFSKRNRVGEFLYLYLIEGAAFEKPYDPSTQRCSTVL